MSPAAGLSHAWIEVARLHEPANVLGRPLGGACRHIGVLPRANAQVHPDEAKRVDGLGVEATSSDVLLQPVDQELKDVEAADDEDARPAQS